MSDYTEADRIEQLAPIHQLLNDAILKKCEALGKASEIPLIPLTMIVASFGTGAAIFGAAFALLEWLV
jgi:hypothetical protein